MLPFPSGRPSVSVRSVLATVAALLGAACIVVGIIVRHPDTPMKTGDSPSLDLFGDWAAPVVGIGLIVVGATILVVVAAWAVTRVPSADAKTDRLDSDERPGQR